MQNYEQVLETIELALSKGEYHFCVQFISESINAYPLSSKRGVHLRTLLITALCAVNRKEEAKKFCKELIKLYDKKTRGAYMFLAIFRF